MSLPTELIANILCSLDSFEEAYQLSKELNYLPLTLKDLINKFSIGLVYASTHGYIDVLEYLKQADMMYSKSIDCYCSNCSSNLMKQKTWTEAIQRASSNGHVNVNIMYTKVQIFG